MLMGLGLTFSLIFGAVAGSFFNVCIDRIPRRQSVVYPSSHCPACEHRLTPVELVPVVSFLRQQGCCKQCGEQIAPWYPVVEGATGVVFALLYWWHGFGATWIAAVVLAGFLIVISGIDLQHRIIPNRVLLAALPLVVVWRGWQAAMGGNPGQVTADLLLGALFGGGLLYVLHVGSRGGLGLGDVKFAFVFGALLGWPAVVYALTLAGLAGTIFGVGGILRGELTRKSEIPFGPFLAFGVLTVFLAVQSGGGGMWLV